METDGPHRPRQDEPEGNPPHGGPPEAQPSTRGGAGPPPEQREERKVSSWEAADRKRRTALVVRLVLGLTLLILFVVFVTQNADEVPVQFLFAETRTPLAWVFLVCALVGGLVAYLLGRQGRRSTRKYIKELEHRLDERGDKR